MLTARRHRPIPQLFAVLTLALCLIGPFPVAAEGISADALAATREHLRRLEKLGFAGSLLIAQDGHPLLAEGYGLADRERGRPWGPATVSTIGSITKQFTGAAILALVDDGLVQVSDPIGTYFDQVPEDKRSITLYHLLTHSSGMLDLEGLGDWDAIDREELVHRALAQELAFAPGERFAYSNAGYSLLGAIVEKVSGESYERFLQRRLLHPAGLYETGYVLAPWDEGRLAQGYQGEERWGTVLERPMAEDGPYWVLRANGGIHSDAYDMLRWVEALRAGRVLSEESRKTLWARHVDEGYGDSFYGYGWVRMDRDGHLVLTHNGGNRIFFADLAVYPDDGVVLFLQTNVAADQPIVEGLLEGLGRHLLAGQPLGEVPDLATEPPEDLASLTGTYALDGGGSVRISAQGDELRITPEDAEGFTRLLSKRPLGRERARRLSGRTDAILAWLRGDYQPLFEAYNKEYPVARLSANRKEMLRQGQEKYGPLRGHEVVGAAARAEDDATLARILFKNGHVERTYLWSLEDEPALLGLSGRGLTPVLRVLPEADGGFVVWDAETGGSRPLEFERAEDGVRWTLDEGERAVHGRATPAIGP